MERLKLGYVTFQMMMTMINEYGLPFVLYQSGIVPNFLPARVSLGHFSVVYR